MIDKSIRQHYQDGEKVDQLKKWTTELTGKYFPQDKTGLDERQLLKNVAGSAAKNLVTRKLATQLGGTGILSSLGPIGMLIAYMLAKKGVSKGQDYLTQKLTKGGVEEAWQAGFGSPQEGRELRVLENRRAKMLQRKEEGKNYSERNLDIVTRAIAEAKGLDINNPNEMKNIDKPITQIQIEKRITEPQIIPEEPEVKSPFAKAIPKTPDIISPHLEGDEIIPTPTVVPKTPSIISPHLEIDEIMPTPSTITRDVGLGDAGIAERIAAENRATAQQAAAVKAESDRQQREADAAAAAAARAAAARAYTPPVRHHTGGGGNGGGGGMGRGRDPGGGAAGSPFFRGGRIDKALGGRVRDI
jgi:hypothetical protein